MKTLLAILLLIPSLSLGKIYNCEVKKKFSIEQFIIEYDEKQNPYAVASIDRETGIFDDNSTLHFMGQLGKLTILGTSNDSFELIIQHAYEKSNDDSFRAFYIDNSVGFNNTYINSIIIQDWKQNSPIYIYDDYFNEIYEGFCK
jgi:hypothetical protein